MIIKQLDKITRKIISRLRIIQKVCMLLLTLFFYPILVVFVCESCLSFVYNFSNFLLFLRFGLPTQDMSCGQNKINQSVSPVGENIIQIYKERESVCARERERERFLQEIEYGKLITYLYSLWKNCILIQSIFFNIFWSYNTKKDFVKTDHFELSPLMLQLR